MSIEDRTSGGLYSPDYEHDACGVGMIVNIHGSKSHELVDDALKVLEHMKHRGAEGADQKTGDGFPTNSSSCKESPFPKRDAMVPDSSSCPKTPKGRRRFCASSWKRRNERDSR